MAIGRKLGQLLVGNTPVPWKANSLQVIENLNRRSTLRADVVSKDGSLIPAMDQVVELRDDQNNVLFKGFVNDPVEGWLAQGPSVVTTINAEDFSALADRRIVTGSTSGGFTGRDAIDYLVTNFLAVYGVTRDPGMGTGAVLGALTYDYAKVSDVLNDIVRLAAPEGWLWRIDENKVLTAFLPGLATEPCPWSMSPSSTKVAGGDISITRSREYYANRVILQYGDGTSTPAVVTADDAGEQAAYGIYEVAIKAAGPFNVTTAQSVATSYLTRLVIRPRQIKFQTIEPGARAGQTLSVVIPQRNLNANFLITDLEIRDFDNRQPLYTITAIEGGVLASSWRDTFRQWSGGASGLVQVGGTIVTSVVGRSTYFLGGSGIAGQQSPGPSVLDAVGYIDVMLDSAALPLSTSITAVVQCKAASPAASVTPQVYNITTATVAGTGSMVTGTNWQTVTFPIARANGQNIYRLRMTPSAANVDVFTLGYLEVGR